MVVSNIVCNFAELNNNYMTNKDFHIRITRGHGPGGQHRNKVETCAIVTHIETGLTETCQDSRSKLANIETAKNKLMVRILALQEQKKHENRNRMRKKLLQNPKVIRTYNYTRNEVIDHRTKKHYDLNKFMEGEIDFPINLN